MTNPTSSTPTPVEQDDRWQITGLTAQEVLAIEAGLEVADDGSLYGPLTGYRDAKDAVKRVADQVRAQGHSLDLTVQADDVPHPGAQPCGDVHSADDECGACYEMAVEAGESDDAAAATPLSTS